MKLRRLDYNITSRLFRWLKRSLLLFGCGQALVIGVLMVIDARRKRFRSQGGFPRARPAPIELAG